MYWRTQRVRREGLEAPESFSSYGLPERSFRAPWMRGGFGFRTHNAMPKSGDVQQYLGDLDNIFAQGRSPLRCVDWRGFRPILADELADMARFIRR